MCYYDIGGHSWLFVYIVGVIDAQSHIYSYLVRSQLGKDRTSGKHTHTHTETQPNSESAFLSESLSSISIVEMLPGWSRAFVACVAGLLSVTLVERSKLRCTLRQVKV